MKKKNIILCAAAGVVVVAAAAGVTAMKGSSGGDKQGMGGGPGGRPGGMGEMEQQTQTTVVRAEEPETGNIYLTTELLRNTENALDGRVLHLHGMLHETQSHCRVNATRNGHATL